MWTSAIRPFCPNSLCVCVLCLWVWIIYISFYFLVLAVMGWLLLFDLYCIAIDCSVWRQIFWDSIQWIRSSTFSESIFFCPHYSIPLVLSVFFLNHWFSSQALILHIVLFLRSFLCDLMVNSNLPLGLFFVLCVIYLTPVSSVCLVS